MKLDILCFAAHPDDVELSMGGTIINHVKKGYKVGIVDLTRGELGSRGTAETRTQEAAEASKILGLAVRENLDLGDGFFEINDISLKALIRMIRLYRPDTVFCNAPKDRHPDHGRGFSLAERACFLSGLVKVETEFDGLAQNKWRPKAVYSYIQDELLEPDFVVDVSDVFDARMAAILAYKTQFYNPESKEPVTPISSSDFIDFIHGRSAEFGRRIGVKHGEGFISKCALPVKNVLDLLP